MSAADATNAQSNGEAEQGKVLVGNFSFQVSERDMKTISESIGDVIEAQVILRGSEALGYGHVYFRKEGEQGAAGEIAGATRVRKTTRGRGRGARGGRGGRGGSRRSGDDAERDAAIEEIESTNKVTLDKDAVAAKNELAKEVEGKVPTVPAAGGRGKGAKGARGGRGAARAAKPRPARGEPSKTLVFLRNLPYTHTTADVESLLSSSSLPAASSISIPKWSYGIHKGQGKGFAFIVTSSAEEQEKVINALNGKEITVEVPLKEGETEKKERTLKMQARQGYENEQNEGEAKDEEGGNGVNDSGTAETGEVKKEESA